jgi:hypothetical protein
MSKRYDELELRQANLLARCAVQRRHLAQTSADIERQLGGVDRGLGIVRKVASRPALLVGGIAVIALIGPRRVLSFASRALVLFTTARRVLGLVRAARGSD